MRSQLDGHTPVVPSAEVQADAQHQICQLVKLALETPTPEQFIDCFDFTNRFRRLAGIVQLIAAIRA
jgi:hypothetical protein